MRYTNITIGYTRYVIEKNTANISSLYLHLECGCTYLGSWDNEEFEQAASKIYQINSGYPAFHYYGG